ncbi:MAG: hypothetical protein ACM31C_12595 [Acidobacteriota bacterium]
MRKLWLASLAVLAGCPDVGTDMNDNAVPYVEFDPANSIVPFPNNLVIDPSTGRVNLPKQACETPAQAAIRTGVLNKLDGFGTYELGMQFTLSEAADPTTLTSDNLVLYKRADSGMPLASPGQPVPVVAFPAKTARFDAADCANPTMVDAVTVVPMAPLDQHSTYTLAVLDGVKPASGGDFKASFVWGLVRQSQDPVAFDAMGNVVMNRTPIPSPTKSDVSDPNYAQLVGVDQLWKAHATALAFLDQTGKLTANRANVLVATDFNTETTTDPLDPNVAGSPANAQSTTALLGTTSVATAKGAPCNAAQGCTLIFTAALGPNACSALPCTAVGDVLGAGLGTQPYQVLGPNPLAGAPMIPGAWNDPIHPTAQTGQILQVLAFVPNPNVVGAMPAGGWPTVAFGHGLGSSKESLFAIAAQLAKAGFASIAIDWQAHGSRAVPVSKDPSLGCAGTCYTNAGTNSGTPCDTLTACATATDTCGNMIGSSFVSIAPTEAPQCYAPFLSPDLAATRDNIRQSVLDMQRLIHAMKACGASNCAAGNNGTMLAIDPAHIVYMGISLGGIMGSTTDAVEPDFKAAVLNVPGAGWFDILENTQNLTIRCGLVNALIDAGVVMGTKYPNDPQGALCLTDAWKQQPGYIQFSSIGRWVLDPADDANFDSPHPSFPGLDAKKWLIQEVIDDQVVPNIATDNEGALAGAMPLTADPFTPATSTASAAITTDPTSPKWVRYPSLPATDPTTGGFGNAFEHASLLRPAAVGPGHCATNPSMVCAQSSDCGAVDQCIFPGVLGTARVQTDAITFLFVNH